MVIPVFCRALIFERTFHIFLKKYSPNLRFIQFSKMAQIEDLYLPTLNYN